MARCRAFPYATALSMEDPTYNASPDSCEHSPKGHPCVVIAPEGDSSTSDIDFVVASEDTRRHSSSLLPSRPARCRVTMSANALDSGSPTPRKVGIPCVEIVRQHGEKYFEIQVREVKNPMPDSKFDLPLTECRIRLRYGLLEQFNDSLRLMLGGDSIQEIVGDCVLTKSGHHFSAETADVVCTMHYCDWFTVWVEIGDMLIYLSEFPDEYVERVTELS